MSRPDIEEIIAEVRAYVALGGALELRNSKAPFVITAINGITASGYRLYAGYRRYETVQLQAYEFEALWDDLRRLRRRAAAERLEREAS